MLGSAAGLPLSTRGGKWVKKSAVEGLKTGRNVRGSQPFALEVSGMKSGGQQQLED